MSRVQNRRDGGDVTGEREPVERGERGVGGPADARLEHPAAPDRHPELDAEVVDPPGLEVAADPSRLEVDDLAGPDLDRIPRNRHRRDRLVEADGSGRGSGKAGVADEIVLRQRLLDQQEVELVEAAQVVDVVAPVRGVGVDLQRDVRHRSTAAPRRTGSRSQPGSIFSLMRT